MRLKRTLASEAGFTYVAMIVMVTVIGIMMSQAAISWKTLIQRSKEEELIYRGMQVRAALQRYYYGREIRLRTDLKPEDTQRANAKPSPKELKDLLEDPTSTQKLRHIRPFALIDPMTLDEWKPIRVGGKIIGVSSTSELVPIKKANFPYQLEPQDFEEKQKYTEWEFRFDRIPLPQGEGGGVKGLETGTGNGTGTGMGTGSGGHRSGGAPPPANPSSDDE